MGNQGDRGSGGRLRAVSLLGIIGVGLYAGVVAYVGWEPIASTARSVDLRLVAAFMALEAVALFLRAYKWRYVLGPNKGSAGVFFLSKAGGNLSPARVGELSPLLLRDFRNAQTATWIVADRALEVAVTLSLGALGAFALSMSLAGFRLPAIIAVVCIALGGLVVALRPWRWDVIRQGLLARPFAARVVATAGEFVKAVVQMRGKLPLLTAVTILSKLIDLTVGLLLYLSLSHAVGYAALAVAQSVHGLTSAIPITPNATGVPYATAGAFLHEAAGIPIEALALAVPLRMATTGTVFWILFGLCCYADRRYLGTPLQTLRELWRRRAVRSAVPVTAEAGDDLG